MKRSFAIVTAGAAWKMMLREFVSTMPERELFRDVYSIDTTGISISREPEQFTKQIANEIRKARADGAEVVILGGAAFAGLSERLNSEIPLIDCVAAAVDEIMRMQESPVGRETMHPPIEAVGLSDQLRTLLVSRGQSSVPEPNIL
jgi:Asp/Glu/hydantoin racemase